MATDRSYSPPSLATLGDLPLKSSPGAAIVSLQENPEKDVELSHASFRSCCAQFSQTLTALDLNPGDRVAIVVPNSPEFVVAFLAVTGFGAVAAPLNSAYKADEFAFYLKDANVKLVIVPRDLAVDAPVVLTTAKLKIRLCRLPKNILVPPAELVDYPKLFSIEPESEAMFLHTSGTTSRPKGVPLTHANLCASIANIAATYELTPVDRSLLVMPLFHVHGLMSATLSTLATGGAVLFPPGGKFSASRFWPSIVRGSATWFTAVPTIHQILLARAEANFPAGETLKLRFARSCSASLAPSVLKRLEETFGVPVLEAYAMTEAAHQMTSNPLPKHGARIAGSVGLPQNVDLCILDEKDTPVRVGGIGEVCIRGNNVTKGYANNPEANQSAFSSGWFHTGDQGRLDAEGYLTLTGRLKELVNRGGEKISPLEVDAVLLAHAGVTEAVSFAVPDEKYGEEVNAAVILKEGVTGVGEEELKKFAGERLAEFKVPKKIFVCDDLPRTATGKIQRRIVSKHFVGGD